MPEASPPPPIEPDDKDWTWVLERPCPECGFDAASLPRDDVADLLRDVVDAWVDVLDGDRPAVGRRPAPDVWSPLEYGAHVRDVFRIYRGRLRLMLTEDGPHYPNWDQDETAVEQRYDLDDPTAVAGRLVAEGTKLADAFAAVGAQEWQRTGYRGDGAEFTVESFARYFVHDPIHHLHDVGAPLPR